MTGKAVVLHSGGQDSTTCLAWAVDQFGEPNVYPLVINYGQRHSVEIEQARKIARLIAPTNPVHETVVPSLREFGSAALTNDNIDVNVNAEGTGNVYAEKRGLPSTFVPGRNALFFALAAAYAAPLGASHVVTGVCATDDAGYPDCRIPFIGSMGVSLRLALGDDDFRLLAPLLTLSKADTFALAAELNVLDVVLEDTHTCYHGDREHRFSWGYGCGECGACHERAKGWAQYNGRRERAEV